MTPEDENVIEARSGYGHASRVIDSGEILWRSLDSDGRPVLRDINGQAVTAHAPKPAMTAEHRARALREMWARNDEDLFSITVAVNLENSIRAAESAAWNRAIEAVEALAVKWDEQTHRGSYAWIGYVTALKGKCHAEAAP